MEKAKEAVAGAAEGVTEDIGVGERPVHKHQAKARKPKMATMGVRQTWDDCVGEQGDRQEDPCPFVPRLGMLEMFARCPPGADWSGMIRTQAGREPLR